MIDVDNYFNNFTPKLNEERFEELLNEPPRYLESPNGKISIDPRLYKSILGSCRLLNKEFDRNNIYYGGEGTGKSHTAFQHAFIWWWTLTELGMINYEFKMEDIVYGRIRTLMDAFDKYAKIPYVIYVLDESDELNRKNHQKPEVKELMSKLRRERKNLRILNFILPAIEEILPAIVLSRINWIFELKLGFDKKLNPVRGYYNLFNIPSSYRYFSSMQGIYLTQKEIKSYLNARFYNNDKKFESLPRKLLSFTGYTNKTFVFDKEDYKEWSMKINNELKDEDLGNSKLSKYEVGLWQLCFELYTNKQISQAKLTKILPFGKNKIAELCTNPPPAIID